MDSAKISIIIPAYNEEEGLDRALGSLMPIAAAKGWEVIVVDDGSTDKTPEVVKEQGASLISHPVNKGYGASLKTGIRVAGGEVVIIMDSDGQHDASGIEQLLEHIDRYDMVVGARKKNVLIRAPGKKLLSLVANFLSGVKIPDLNSGFRAIRKNIVKSFLHICPNGFSFTTTITLAFLREGYNVKYVPLEAEMRVGRKSSVKFFRDGYKTFLLIIRVIVLFNPLKVFIPASLFLLVAGVLFTLYGIISFGRAPNVGILAILSSIILFFMGILADQISAIRRERRLD
ncbi:MAG: glycosyltransferase family 2 protein [Candidatus Krumholzibacteriota bacterium]|nr:glycosyltransferase family 2 protein [Candidatus Krumholzibacteriota bacterium]